MTSEATTLLLAVWRNTASHASDLDPYILYITIITCEVVLFLWYVLVNSVFVWSYVQCGALDFMPFDSLHIGKWLVYFQFMHQIAFPYFFLITLSVFSERQLTFTFAICYRCSVCLSVTLVCPSQRVEILFPQFFFAVWYLGHPLTSTENFMEIVPAEPLHRGFKRKSGSEIWQFLTLGML